MKKLCELLETLEKTCGIVDDFDLCGAILEGVCPNGNTLEENQRKVLLRRLCVAAYSARAGIDEIKTALESNY